VKSVLLIAIRYLRKRVVLLLDLRSVSVTLDLRRILCEIGRPRRGGLKHYHFIRNQ
jgi:hypothetical protein